MSERTLLHCLRRRAASVTLTFPSVAALTKRPRRQLLSDLEQHFNALGEGSQNMVAQVSVRSHLKSRRAMREGPGAEMI
ncbi:hypothetical protein BD626DRAFT_487253 [Schizophyllum amplum]|uniref:Uncharacterized protein n=1 Tax=Schizophyllum amplum TaxID=97359 RepID=A0A550CNE4_9AGAR|nr:hypothetical protein BD626DRAFT_487253 [Auriculariopsis ampla]